MHGRDLPLPNILLDVARTSILQQVTPCHVEASKSLESRPIGGCWHMLIYDYLVFLQKNQRFSGTFNGEPGATGATGRLQHGTVPE